MHQSARPSTMFEILASPDDGTQFTFFIASSADACRRAYEAENRSNYHTANYSNLPAVKNYFAATKGSRNNCAYKAAYAMLANSYSENETLEMLNMGPIEKNEIKQVITSAKRGNK